MSNGHHNQPPPPPPPVVTPPPAPLTVIATTFTDIAAEYQNGVSELLTGNTAASTDLQQAAFDLAHEGAIVFPADQDMLRMVGDIDLLAQVLNTNPTAANNLMWDVEQEASVAFGGGVGNYNSSATAPSSTAMEDNATEWNLLSHFSTGVQATAQNLTTINNGDLSHLTYTETQVQGVLSYYQAQIAPDAAFVGPNAADLAHIVGAETAALHSINDMLTNGGAASPHYTADQQEISAASVTLQQAEVHLLQHNLPPPNFWMA